MRFYVGIDVGGTFTDGVVINEAGDYNLFKTPSTPKDPNTGFLDCLSLAAEHYSLKIEQFLACVEKLSYGTTLATNLLLEGKGAVTGFITTKGFKDILSIARVGREYLSQDLQFDKPPDLVPPHLIEEVVERCDCKGNIVTPLNIQGVKQSLRHLLSRGAEAVAVSLLWSFKNPEHERTIGKIIDEEFPHLYYSLSSDVAPIIGEYERGATTIMNASLGKPLGHHFHKLQNELKNKGLHVPLMVMQSTGGLVPADNASAKPIYLANSGPAGGVLACKGIGELLGYKNIIGIDMGGTSLDISLIVNGEYILSTITRIAGHSVFVPQIDIYSIGAGGGSIAWLDMGKRLKVGPHSAAADPGPACYGRGGREPTVTDADLILGYIDANYFIGGGMTLDEPLAKEIVHQKIEKPLGLSFAEAATGVTYIVDSNMAGAIRTVTLRKGYDPRDFVLVAYGGAGPLHAVSLAREFGIRKIIVPSFAPVQSAYGIVSSDIVHSFVLTDVTRFEDFGRLRETFKKLERQGMSLLDKEGIELRFRKVNYYVDARYRGQLHEITVKVPNRCLEEDDVVTLTDAFDGRYEEVYGKYSAYRSVGREIVNVKVEVIGLTPKPRLRNFAALGHSSEKAFHGERQIYLPDRRKVVARIYRGELLKSGNRIESPAIIEYYGTTVLIPPGYTAFIDPYLNVIIEEVA